MTRQLDIASNRAARKYSNREMVWRVLWIAGQWLFRLSPRPCFGWRRFILRCFGAEIGGHVNTSPSTRVLLPWNLAVGDWTALGDDVRIYNPGRIVLGRRVTISHGAHLCSGTHDHTRADLPLLKQQIRIEDQAWICADAFVGPDVIVGEGALVGARAVVTKSVEAWAVVVGNPAKRIGARELCCPSVMTS
jgi:putative colanic acid biosynthesis acetyltransferase WcaF